MTTSLEIAVLESANLKVPVGMRTLFADYQGLQLHACGSLTCVDGFELQDPWRYPSLRLVVTAPVAENGLWVILDLPTVQRHVMSHPYEWELWIGLAPGTTDLTTMVPAVAFEQSIHAIHRYPREPKLRLKLTYRDSRLMAIVPAQPQATALQSEHARSGQQAFEELQRLQAIEAERVQATQEEEQALSQARTLLKRSSEALERAEESRKRRRGAEAERTPPPSPFRSATAATPFGSPCPGSAAAPSPFGSPFPHSATAPSPFGRAEAFSPFTTGDTPGSASGSQIVATPGPHGPRASTDVYKRDLLRGDHICSFCKKHCGNQGGLVRHQEFMHGVNVSMPKR